MTTSLSSDDQNFSMCRLNSNFNYEGFVIGHMSNAFEFYNPENGQETFILFPAQHLPICNKICHFSKKKCIIIICAKYRDQRYHTIKTIALEIFIRKILLDHSHSGMSQNLMRELHPMAHDFKWW